MSTQLVAALCTRTSHEKDDAFSLSSQLSALREDMHEQGFTVPEEYIFQEEYTGKVADRPELPKVRKLMREGAIDILAVFDASRFARKIGVADILLDEVFESGVQLYLSS
jgi:DNA invertase Pin-like site-specific DNA recombinase